MLESASRTKRPHNTKCIIDEDCFSCEVLNRPSKRVRFASIPQRVIESSTSIAECSTESKWYNKKDFKTFVSASAVLARNSSGKEYYLAQLVHTYSSCCTDDDTKNPQSAAQLLALCTIATENNGTNNSNDEDSQRGLERLSAYQHVGLGTSLRRKSLVRTVLLAQCAMKATMNDSTLVAANTDHRAILLQSISEQLSQPSKKFAAALGTADAFVALIEYRKGDSQNAR
jgi:hypothetical protein